MRGGRVRPGITLTGIPRVGLRDSGRRMRSRTGRGSALRVVVGGQRVEVRVELPGQVQVVGVGGVLHRYETLGSNPSCRRSRRCIRSASTRRSCAFRAAAGRNSGRTPRGFSACARASAAVGIRIGTALIVGVGALDVELRDDEGLVAAPHGEVGHEAGFGLPAGVVVDRHHVAVAGAGFDDALRIFAPVVEARSEDQVLRVGFADGLARDLEIVVGDGRAEFLAVGFGDGLRRGDALLRP